jgi:hypothetical protein
MPTTAAEQVSGRELDAAIHIRVMGYPSECRLIGDGESMETALRYDFEDAAYRVRSDSDEHWENWSPDGAERIVIAPHYSSEITDAFRVVEKMRERGVWAEIYTFTTRPMVVEMVTEKGALGKAEASSMSELPTAICRAALAAIEGE